MAMWNILQHNNIKTYELQPRTGCAAKLLSGTEQGREDKKSKPNHDRHRKLFTTEFDPVGKMLLNTVKVGYLTHQFASFLNNFVHEIQPKNGLVSQWLEIDNS